MQKIVYYFLLMLIFSCNSNAWNKPYVVAKCKKEMERQYKNNTLFTKERVERLCDCIAEKTIQKYASEAALNKDSTGAREIGYQCSIAAEMSKTNLEGPK